MMKNAILIHGTCDREEYFDPTCPSLSNSHWFPWLQKQLLIAGIPTQTPEMFRAFEPSYDLWKQELERFDIDEKSILVGHSCGGGFLVRWLSENKKRIDKLVLIAPWLDPFRSKTADFFEFEIDIKMSERVKEIHLFVSNDDEADIHESVKIIHKCFPQLFMHEFESHGHFTLGDMGTQEFPELLNILIS